MKNDVKTYLKEIKLLIPLNSKEKKQFLDMLKEQIYASNIIMYNELIQHFGTPNEVAASYIENLDTNTIIKKLKIRNYLKVIALIIVFCILLTSLFRMYRLNQLYEEAKMNINGHYSEEIVEDDGIIKENTEEN